MTFYTFLSKANWRDLKYCPCLWWCQWAFDGPTRLHSGETGACKHMAFCVCFLWPLHSPRFRLFRLKLSITWQRIHHLPTSQLCTSFCWPVEKLHSISIMPTTTHWCWRLNLSRWPRRISFKSRLKENHAFPSGLNETIQTDMIVMLKIKSMTTDHWATRGKLRSWHSSFTSRWAPRGDMTRHEMGTWSPDPQVRVHSSPSSLELSAVASLRRAPVGWAAFSTSSLSLPGSQTQREDSSNGRIYGPIHPSTQETF